MVLKPEIAEDEITVFFGLVDDLAAELRILRNTHAQTEGDAVKKELMSALIKLRGPTATWGFDFTVIAQHTERLQLLAASLPPDGERRSVQLRSAEFLVTVFALIQAIHEGQETKDDDHVASVVKRLQSCIDSMETRTLDEACAEVVKALQVKGFEHDMTHEVLAKTLMGLEKDALGIISKWTIAQARI